MVHCTLAKVRTAIKNAFEHSNREGLFAPAGVPLPTDWEAHMKDFVKGTPHAFMIAQLLTRSLTHSLLHSLLLPRVPTGKKKKQAKERERGQRKAKEGSDHLPKKALIYLGDRLIRSGEHDALFAWAFMLMAWSLCCRMDEVNVVCYRTYSTQAGPMLNLLTCLTNHRYFPLQLSALGARKLKPTTQTRRHSEWQSLFNYLLAQLSPALQTQLQSPTEELATQAWGLVSPKLYDNVKYADQTADGEKYRCNVPELSLTPRHAAGGISDREHSIRVRIQDA